MLQLNLQQTWNEWQLCARTGRHIHVSLGAGMPVCNSHMYEPYLVQQVATHCLLRKPC
jgi:hypothetical protein